MADCKKYASEVSFFEHALLSLRPTALLSHKTGRSREVKQWSGSLPQDFLDGLESLALERSSADSKDQVAVAVKEKGKGRLSKVTGTVKEKGKGKLLGWGHKGDNLQMKELVKVYGKGAKSDAPISSITFSSITVSVGSAVLLNTDATEKGNWLVYVTELFHAAGVVAACGRGYFLWTLEDMRVRNPMFERERKDGWKRYNDAEVFPSFEEAFFKLSDVVDVQPVLPSCLHPEPELLGPVRVARLEEMVMGSAKHPLMVHPVRVFRRFLDIQSGCLRDLSISKGDMEELLLWLRRDFMTSNACWHVLLLDWVRSFTRELVLHCSRKGHSGPARVVVATSLETFLLLPYAFVKHSKFTKGRTVDEAEVEDEGLDVMDRKRGRSAGLVQLPGKLTTEKCSREEWEEVFGKGWWLVKRRAGKKSPEVLSFELHGPVWLVLDLSRGEATIHCGPMTKYNQSGAVQWRTKDRHRTKQRKGGEVQVVYILHEHCTFTPEHRGFFMLEDA